MNQTPLVSILMPAYTQVDYISEALDSLKRQTYQNWEVAIVDDGSPDNVAEVVKPYCETDSRIRFYHTDNNGVSGARNYAAGKTSGKYIIPLDADDIFEPEYIERCVKALEENPNLKVAYCYWNMFGAVTKSPHLEYKGYADLLIANTIFCSAMYRRSDFERVGGYDTEIPFGFEDWEFWISLLDKDAEVYQIPQKLFNYRIKESSRSTVVNTSKNLSVTTQYIYRKHIADYLSVYPNMIEILQRLKHLEYRDSKWKKRSMPSRLWHAVTGTI